MLDVAPAISLKGRHVLADVTLFGPVEITLPAGQWTCVLGRSGVGKTTLLRLMAGLDCAGRFDGTITTSDTRPVAGRASLMAQDDLLLPWLDVLENTVLGARLRGDKPDIARAQELLHRVGLGDHQTRKPGELSGGMRQRTALARTLMENRPIAFLDEPFSALDASTRAEMQELTGEMLAGRTVLLVTHDPAEAIRLGHQVIVFTSRRAQSWPLPSTLPLRDIYAPEIVANLSDLMARLRALR
ncbi:MAG: ABC transporter ATP-binding protein [Gammaproteobacteria bacterium]|nr:MAG: ABC transporter ATP-binding protein [Gammaproteobacteria bacterium]